MVIRKYELEQNKVTAIVRDSNFLWIAYEKSGSTCLLQKVSAFNPKQVYYNVNVSADKIIKMFIISTNIYLLIESNLYIMLRYVTSNPITSPSVITKRPDIFEFPIDVTNISTDSFVLFPGNASGQNAKIVKYTNITYETTIDLQQSAEIINNANAITNDGSNLWVTTYDTPSRLVKIYGSGVSYNFQSWKIF